MFLVRIFDIHLRACRALPFIFILHHFSPLAYLSYVLSLEKKKKLLISSCVSVPFGSCGLSTLLYLNIHTVSFLLCLSPSLFLNICLWSAPYIHFKLEFNTSEKNIQTIIRFVFFSAFAPCDSNVYCSSYEMMVYYLIVKFSYESFRSH